MATSTTYSGVYFSAIYARDDDGLIGVDGKLPWRCPKDLSWFHHHTDQKVVIMGRRTWDSLPSGSKPLPNRFNIVVSRQPLDPTRHMFRMLLDEPYFSQIRRGEKKIEGRLSTTERSHIDTGDTILFVKSTAEGKEPLLSDANTFVRTVASVGHYQNFQDMLTKEGVENVLPGVSSVEAGIQVYRKFYTTAAEVSAGVLAIRLLPQPPASQLIQEATPNNTTFRTHSFKHALLLAQLLIAQTKSTAAKADVGTTAGVDVKKEFESVKKEFDLVDVEGGAGIFVIGGSQLLSDAFEHPGLERIFETRIKHFKPTTTTAGAGTTKQIKALFDKPIPREFIQVDSHTFPNSVFATTSSATSSAAATTAATATSAAAAVVGSVGEAVMGVWVRRRPGAEREYLNLLSKVMTTGVVEVDRTGVGTVSTFGEMFRCDLKDGFPLLTSKKVFWKGVVEELLWFLRGETNVAKLHEAGVHFWDGNLNSAHTKSLKLPPGELGPVYGRQWRAFGPDGAVCPHGCLVPGVDQIKRLIDDIRSSPNSRRLIVSAWNPMVIDKVALPSCHCFMQFEVKAKQLSCLIYLRSNDLFLGAPLNIASYALLTHIIAAMTGLQPGHLVYTVGNAHIYKNHVEQVKLQLARPNRHLPALHIDQKTIDQIYPPITTTALGATTTTTTTTPAPNFALLSRKHFTLSDYCPLGTLSAIMAV